ncbi:MAG: glutamate-5-semialdehyde dehydrogenase [Myxococcota bacterium]
MATAAREAARALSRATTAHKDAVLLRIGAGLEARRADILAANAKDVSAAEAAGLAPALVDRLRLDDGRLDEIVAGVRSIAQLADPAHAVVSKRKLSNGLSVSRVRLPLGVIAIVYEARPGVTVDAAALCIKSGNAVILRGGKEAFGTNQVLAEVLAQALQQEGLPEAAAALVPTTDRSATLELIQAEGLVDLAIPRGGEGLIRFVSENARVPVIRHYKGVCHVYVDVAADLDKAVAIVLNAKTQKPSACNAAETLLVDGMIAPLFLPRVGEALRAAGVRLHAEQGAREYVGEASESPDFDREYLALEMNVAVVDGVEGAIEHVARHGSLHTEAIVSEDTQACARWVREVDASVVLTNASTRFNDGGQLGLGAEMGISTTKLHAYGPMGLEELCALKWVVRGNGQTRA